MPSQPLLAETFLADYLQASSTHRRGIVPPTPSHAPAIPQEPKTTSDPAGLWDDSLSDYDTDVFDPYSDFPRGHQSGLLGSHRVFDPITDEVARKYYERYGSRVSSSKSP